MRKGEGVYNVVVIGAGTAGLVTAAGTAGLGGRGRADRTQFDGRRLPQFWLRAEQGAHFFSPINSTDPRIGKVGLGSTITAVRF